VHTAAGLVQPSDWREAPMSDMSSLNDMNAPILPKIKYHQKEREVRFQNSGDPSGICFSFT
jgi:hypothetical protein